MKFHILGSAFIALIILIIFFISIIYYRRYLKDKKIKPIIILSLRCLSLLVLLFLFIDPFLSYIKSDPREKRINLFVDNSRSILQSMPIDSLESHIDKIERWGNEKEYKTNFYLFGETLRPSRDIDLDDSSTRYDHLLNKINSSSKDINIILTDGNPTHGFRLSDLEINNPLNILGVGEAIYQDITIENIICPRSVNIGDSINLSINVHSNLDSRSTPTLQISSEDSILYNTEINLSSGQNRYQYNINISAPDNHIGTLTLDAIILDSSINENKLNNIYKTQTLIEDISKEILFISGSLNPNTQLIKEVLNDIPNLSIVHLYKVKNKWNKLPDNIDLNTVKFFVYDNFPIIKADLDLYKKIEKRQNEKSKIIYFEGPSYDFNTLNNIFLEGKEFTKDDNQRKKIVSNKIELSNLVPVRKNLKIHSKYFQQIYLTYSDSSVAIAEENKNLYLFIPELSKIFINDTKNSFKEYISKILFLFIDFGDHIQLSTSKREILEGEHLFIDINYPDIYNNLPIDIIIEDRRSKEKKTIPFNKIKKNISGDRYLDNLDAGVYDIYANVISRKNLYTSNPIVVSVTENSFETSFAYRNENEMRIAALRSKGMYFNIEGYKSLESLMSSQVILENKNIELNVHSFHKFWFILLITLIIEWFLRKQKGLL